jgi:3-deoxy-manno-octulosonate cytidylyltransferase (CMP-KDO synthetase)
VPGMVEASAKPIVDDLGILCTNLVARIGSEEDFLDRNTIKVLKNDADQAIYFSRAPIPSTALVAFADVPAYKQVCVISFSLAGLREFSRLEPTPLEQVESIDMLRYLEHRIPVRLVPTDRNTHAVDTPEDLLIVEAMLRDDPLTKEYL